MPSDEPPAIPDPAAPGPAAPRPAAAQGPEGSTQADGAAEGSAPRRARSRREAVLDRAAALFAERGFEGASMRDIAAAAGMLPGSLYYHFPSKEALALEIHARVVARMTARVEAALEGVAAPWPRLEAAAAAHLEGLLETGNLVAIVSPDFSGGRPGLKAGLRAQRRDYEALFRDLVAALPLRPGSDRRLLRLQLLGALHWTPVWYDAGGPARPAEIARAFAATLRAAHGAPEAEATAGTDPAAGPGAGSAAGSEAGSAAGSGGA